LLKTESFDIALIDIGLPKRTGLDVMAEVRARNIPVKIIILTGDTDTHSPRAIAEAGADAFLYKTTDADGFLDTFIAVVKGKPVTHGDSKDAPSAATVAEIRDTLTPRELQIVKLVVEGASNKKAAEALFISQHTVRKHREHINAKLSIKSPTALAAFAIKAGLV
jgi:DNA-binding NarL/FixJ family response regulator